MRIVVCGQDRSETGMLCAWIKDYAQYSKKNLETFPVSSASSLRQVCSPGAFEGALIGLGDSAGFLAARQLREQDTGCRVVLIDDTDRYAIQGMRIHLTDFILRPLNRSRFDSAMDRMSGMR